MNPKMAAVAGLSLAGAVAGVFFVTRPSGREARTPAGPTVVERLPGELPPVRDEVSHHAPGSAPAVAEAFLRAWWRGHYDEAQQLSTGEMRRRCAENLTKTLALPPDLREQMRQVQVVAEAAAFDLERAVTTDLAPDDGGVARKEVRGEIHAHGRSPDGRPVESRRAQVLELALVEGAWKVARWTPGRTDAGISVGASP